MTGLLPLLRDGREEFAGGGGEGDTVMAQVRDGMGRRGVDVRGREMKSTGLNRLVEHGSEET